ncbi:MAG: energy transducer TonB [Crocinitomicaceae bacterium]
MNTKKSKAANIEKLRMPIISLSLLFVGSLVLASFSYTSEVERDFRAEASESAIDIVFLEETAKKDIIEPVKQQEVKLPPDTEIRIDSNTTTIPDPIVVVLPPDIEVGKEIVEVIPPVVEFPDVDAQFFGGILEMKKWINANVNYPQEAIEVGDEGLVYLSFVVEEDGSISNIEIERGVSTELDREAKRLIRNMPKWVAGEAKGLPVRSRCRLPINFELY